MREGFDSGLRVRWNDIESVALQLLKESLQSQRTVSRIHRLEVFRPQGDNVIGIEVVGIIALQTRQIFGGHEEEVSSTHLCSISFQKCFWYCGHCICIFCTFAPKK